MANFPRTVLWRNLDQPGAEYCSLFQIANGFRLEGKVVVALENTPLYIQYKITCDQQWRTRTVRVELEQGSQLQKLQIIVDKEQRWWLEGSEVKHLRGCQDVDLSITPATNTLPIRRLDIPVGSSQEITAAWVRFPELNLELLPQRYTHLAESMYDYECYHSDCNNYTTQLEVDDLGLMVEYKGSWQRQGVIKGQ